MHSSATTVYTPNAFFHCLKSSISQPFFAAGSLVERVYFPLHRHMRTQAYATITSWTHMLKLKRLLSSASVRAWSWDARDKEPTEWRISTNEHHQRNMNFFCTTLRSFVPLCVMFPRSLDSTGATPTFNVQMALALMRRQLPAEQQRLCEWGVGLALTTASKDDLWNLVNIVTACACHLQLKLWAFWDLRPIACWNCRNWKKLCNIIYFVWKVSIVKRIAFYGFGMLGVLRGTMLLKGLQYSIYIYYKHKRHNCWP